MRMPEPVQRGLARTEGNQGPGGRTHRIGCMLRQGCWPSGQRLANQGSPQLEQVGQTALGSHLGADLGVHIRAERVVGAEGRIAALMLR